MATAGPAVANAVLLRLRAPSLGNGEGGRERTMLSIKTCYNTINCRFRAEGRLLRGFMQCCTSKDAALALPRSCSCAHTFFLFFSPACVPSRPA